MAQSLTLKAVKSEPSQFASEFCEFYRRIIKNVYDLKCHKFLNHAMEALKIIRRMKHFIANSDKTSFIGDVKYDDIAFRCAYMYSYSVLNTSVAYREFSKHLEENKDENMLLQHFSSKTLKLCCLGGGAGIEAVGVSRAIHDIVWKSHSEDTNSLVDFHLTIVDICSEWESEQSAIVNELNKTTDWYHPMKVNFHFEFFKADLLKPFEDTLQNIILEANIISMVKCVNNVQVESQNLSKCIKKVQVMMKSVIDCMKEESCLFILDAAGGSVFYRIAKVTSQYKSLFQRQMIKHKAYRLHEKTMKRLEDVLHSGGFPEADILFPTQLTRVSSCIWIKKPISTEEEKTKAEKKKRRKEKTKAEKKERKKAKAEKKERRKEKREKEKNEKKEEEKNENGEGDKTKAEEKVENEEEEKNEENERKKEKKKRRKVKKEKAKNERKGNGEDETEAEEKVDNEEEEKNERRKEKEKTNERRKKGEDKTEAEKETEENKDERRDEKRKKEKTEKNEKEKLKTEIERM